MGLIKKNELPNGVNLSYYRIVSLTTIVGVQTVIELAGYTSQEKREEEQAAIIDPEIGCDVYVDTQYLVVDYDPDMSVNKAYALLKAMPEWEDAQDAFNTGDKVHYPTIEDPVYESTIDANVYSPEAYPQGWRLGEGGE